MWFTKYNIHSQISHCVICFWKCTNSELRLYVLLCALYIQRLLLSMWFHDTRIQLLELQFARKKRHFEISVKKHFQKSCRARWSKSEPTDLNITFLCHEIFRTFFEKFVIRAIVFEDRNATNYVFTYFTLLDVRTYKYWCFQCD
jgi:hypothetical protein